jgi:hypothetical protein
MTLSEHEGLPVAELPVRVIPLDPDAQEPHDALGVRLSEVDVLRGLRSLDFGLTWQDPGDPFANKLFLLLTPHGDDWTGTLFYAGLPCLVVFAGGSRTDDTQYEHEYVTYLEPETQHVNALFYTNVVGDLPGEGSDQVDNDEWPWDHGAEIMVLEKDPATGRNYDLYSDLMPESGSQGYEITNLIGVVAHAMHRALPEELPEPVGF